MHLRIHPRSWSAAIASLTILAVLTPSAMADGGLFDFWPFKKKCEPEPQWIWPSEILPKDIKPEPKAEPKVEPKAEPKVEPKAEPKIEVPPVEAPQVMMPPEMGPALGAGGFSLASSNVGYIDSAIPRTMVRFRFDDGHDFRHPNRAEYFYAKYSSIGGPGVLLPEVSIDYQDYRTAFEYAFTRRLSAWIEVPARSINPVVNINAAGFSDINFGFKYAMIAEDNRYFTFQLRTYAPTGAATRGLGTDHYSIEPSLLTWWRFNDRLIFEGQLTDWIPSGGTNYAGNVLQYGIGASYLIWQNSTFRIRPVAEFVGWTVLGGKDTDFRLGVITTTTVPPGGGPALVAGTFGPIGTFDFSATGATIINAKVGGRVDIGDNFSIYVGFGRSLTGDFWYRNLLRVEARLAF
jgi:hypothetical protein